MNGNASSTLKDNQPTTGEWHFDGESRVIDSDGSVICVGCEIQGQDIADDHNAALAAEREKLAGKEEFWSACEVGYEAEIKQLRAQLAAARIELAKVLTGDQLDAALAKVGKP